MNKILTENNPILRQISQPIEIFDEELDELIQIMKETIKMYNGVGLAAPQLGILKRVIVLDFDPYVMINPEIIESGTNTHKIREGCLSFPNLFFDVERSTHAVVRWQDTEEFPHMVTFSGFQATVIQHEIDHLDGKLFVDKISNMALMLAKKKISKFKGPKK